MPTFSEALSDGTVVLDGGLGTLLESHGHDLSSSLWSARLLLEDPGAIRAAHREFFEAGARVAITSSYQVSYEALAAVGLDTAAVEDLLVRSVDLAREARDEAGLTAGEAWIAASVGPFGASRGDGSEYTGDYGLSVAELRAWHRPRLEVLAAAAPDVLAVETLPSLAEVEAVCAELERLGAPAWISVTVADGALRAGGSASEAFEVAADTATVVAAGVNCCEAREVSGAIDAVVAAGLAPLAYPNSGEHWDAVSRTWSGDAAALAAHAAQWSAAGARLIGGCCRVGVAEIRAIAGILDAAATPRP